MKSIRRHNIVRDYIVFSLASFRYFIKIKKPGLFLKELSQFTRWNKFRTSSEGTLHFQIPWLVFGSIDFLEDWLQKDMKMLEYGSGGSTLFFAKRVDTVYSVEHDPEWFTITKSAIKAAGIKNVDYNLLEPTSDEDYFNKNVLVNEDCLSTRSEYKMKNFSNYVRSINPFQDGYFDLVIVDGRARQSCIAYSIPKIKKGGILLLDNAEREFYLQTNPEMKETEKWKRLDFIGHFPFAPASILNKTSVFIKQY